MVLFCALVVSACNIPFIVVPVVDECLFKALLVLQAVR